MIRLLARFALLIATLAAIAAALSGPGYRMEWWRLPMAFGMMRWAVWVAIGAAVFGLVLALIAALARPGGSRRGLAEATLAILVGALTMAGPITLMSRGKQVPPIHDISTDTENPPQFAAVLPARVDAKNPVQYGGPELAAQQKKAYPQIVPVELPVPPAEAFERALRIARDTGWVIIDANQAVLRIEATATTPFFGFKDDVVVRVTPTQKGSRVDMRSLSRIGRSDLGANARRVEDFMAKLGTG